VTNCKFLVVTNAKRKHVRQRARFQQHLEANFQKDFFFKQGKAPKEFHAFLKESLGGMHQRVPPSKNGWPSLKAVIFPPVTRLDLNDKEQ
jgi:hypothetical protein